MPGEDSYFEGIPELQLPQEMKDLAHVIIERKAGHFQPEEFTDRYEDAVVELIRAKQAGMPAKVTEQPTRPSNVVSIMDALRKSIAAEAAKPTAAKPKTEPAPAPDNRLPETEGPIEVEGQGRGRGSGSGRAENAQSQVRRSLGFGRVYDTRSSSEDRFSGRSGDFHGGGSGVNSSRSSGGRSKRPRPQSALRH